MPRIEITLKNYRCFEDTDPAKFVIGDGFTAFVGPNNSGKSSLLKLFHEFRQLFAAAGNGRDIVVQPQSLIDINEVFCDQNTRPLSIQLSSFVPAEPTATMPNLTSISLTLERASVDQSTARQKWRLITQPGPSGILNTNPLLDEVRSLENSLYIGPFRNALREGGSRDYYGLSIGNAFVALWHEWQTGSKAEQNRMVENLTEDLRRIFGFRKFTVAASINLNTLQLAINGRTYKLPEVGSGLAQCLVSLGNAMMLKPNYIFVDEPELGLHPALQTEFITTLASFAPKGLVFSTHSIGLARSVAEHIYGVRMENGTSRITPFSGIRNYAEFLGEMSFSAFQELGGNQVLLVEGVSDVKVVQEFLRKLGCDRKFVVIPLGGDALARGGVDLELAELKRLVPHVVALVDSEREAPDGPAAVNRVAFQNSCKELGFLVHLTDLRAMENYFPTEAIRNVMGDRYVALQPYQPLKNAALAWSKADNWRIAAQMTKDALLNTDVGKFLSGVVV